MPAVFALTRKKMGELYGFRKRVSAVALMEVNGADELYAQMLVLAEEGRAEWAEGAGGQQQQGRVGGDGGGPAADGMGLSGGAGGSGAAGAV